MGHKERPFCMSAKEFVIPGFSLQHSYTRRS